MTTYQIPDENLDRVETYIREGRLLRRRWEVTDEQGRHLACLLVALYPDVGGGDYAACPAGEIPEWLARLLPWINDAPSDEAWPQIIRRTANLLRYPLMAESAQRLDYTMRRIAVMEAMAHTTDVDVVTASQQVLDLLDRAIAGDMPTDEEWTAAVEAAEAEWAAVEAEWAAVVAAWAEAEAAAEAEWAAVVAAWAAVEAAAEAEWAAAANGRMIDQFLTAWAVEVGAV